MKSKDRTVQGEATHRVAALKSCTVSKLKDQNSNSGFAPGVPFTQISLSSNELFICNRKCIDTIAIRIDYEL